MNTRLSTANSYDATISNLLNRQSSLATMQDQLSSGKRVLRPSDDPSGAAQAERASVRISRLQADKAALGLARDAMSTAESSLGDSVSLLQSARDAILGAGNGSYSAAERASLAQQLTDIRSQLLGLANQSDANGQFVYAGQGSSGTPFVSTNGVVSFNGNAGQPAPQGSIVPHSLDGNALFMNVPTGNGVFAVAPAGTNTGSAWSDAGQVISPSALTGHNYSISFTVAGAATTYSVTDTTSGTSILAAQPYVAGQAIQFDGQAITLKGTPASGDQFTVQPSGRTSAFDVLDQAIAGLTNNFANSGQIMQTIQQGLAGLDMSMDRLQAGRSQAGEWLNRADATTARMDAQDLQLTDQQSKAQDMDMVKGISDFQTQQTAYDAALKSYAQVQKLSLFQYISG